MDPNRTQGLKRMTAPNGGIMSKVYVCASLKSIELGLLRVNSASQGNIAQCRLWA
jgi:hypothetical protein